MHKKTNILHVVTNLSDGGLEKIVFLIVSNNINDKFNHFVAVLTKQDNDFLTDKFVNLNIPINNFNFENRFSGFKSLYKNVIELFHLSKQIKSNNIDIIHTHDFFPAFVSRISVLLCRFIFRFKIKRVYVTLHNIFFWLSPIHHRINKILSRYTDKIICVSKSVYNYSKDHDKIKEEKYIVIYNGVECENFVPERIENTKYRNEFGFKEDDILIGNIGVLSVRKGHKYLLNALPEIIKLYPNIKLVIFGSKRSHEQEIADEIYKIIAENNLVEKIFIFEPRGDINRIYNMFDLFVMPSVSEGLSLCAIEAMLMERICLFSDIDPFKEIIDEGVNGFLFNSGDSIDLQNKLFYIIRNYKNLNITGTTARQIALKKYDVKRMAKEYERLYLLEK